MRFLETARHAALALGLTAVAMGAAHATFPGENGVIVYSFHGLWKVPVDGSGPPTLIDSKGGFPMVSPNGKKVAYRTSSPSSNGSGPWVLKVMNLDGSDPQFIDHFESVMVFSAWSPDGKTIAVGNLGYVYLYDLATLSRRTLTTLRYGIERLSWSPLGDKIVATAPYSDGWVIDVATGQTTWLNFLGSPDWFPDYGGSVVGIYSGDDSQYCLNRMNPDGSNRVAFPICQQTYASVSPDGQQVLTSHKLSSTEMKRLTVQSFQGVVLREIAPYADEHADWSRMPKTAMRTTLLANNAWSAPEALAGDSDTYTSNSAIAVMPDNGAQGGALRRALGIGTDGRVYERAQLANGNWGAKALVPGRGKAAGGMLAKQVAIAGALDGSLQAVIVGSDDIVYHAMRYANGSWSGFEPVNGANGAANFAARDVAIAIVDSSTSAPGQAHVVANGLGGGTVYHRVRLDDGNWTPWGAPGGPATNAVAVAFAGNKDLYLLGTTTTGGLARTVRHASGAWDSWVNVGQMPVDPLKDVSVFIASDASTGEALTAYVSYIGSDGQVWFQSRPKPGVASSWTKYPLQWLPVMANGRSVSITLSGSTPELLAVQAQPQ